MKYEKEFMTMLEKCGEESEILVAIEELNELAQALCKYLRIKRNISYLAADEYEKKRLKNLANVKEEIADVHLMAGMMKWHFGEQEIDEIEKQKVARVLGKIRARV